MQYLDSHVRHGDEWPGLRSSPQQVGATLVARRPKLFFSPSGYMPETVELELTPPPGFATGAEFVEILSGAVTELERRHRREIESAGRRFLGVARILAQSPFARPAPGEPRFKLNPRIAARDKWKRIEGIVRLKASSASTGTRGGHGSQGFGRRCSSRHSSGRAMRFRRCGVVRPAPFRVRSAEAASVPL